MYSAYNRMRRNLKCSSIFQLVVIVAPVIALQLILVTQRLDGVVGVGVDDHQHLYTDSFPRNDEYNLMALEPETPFGTPYGGFSRATASRLAALPLKLPSISKVEKGENDQDDEDDGEFDPMYTTVRDNAGRAFACRIFLEDELKASSLGDSMFDTPILKEKPNSSSKESSPSEERNEETSGSEQADPSASQSLSEIGFDPVMVGHTIHQRLKKLTGLCAQLHPPGWWSYEWCHQENIKQFHVKVLQSNGKAQKFELEGITNLGSLSERRIQVVNEDDDDDTNDNEDETDLAQGRKEIGRVIDTFVGGETCPETGEPRVTEATFRCCSERFLRKTKGGVLKNGNQVDTNIISIFEAKENRNAVCRYNITLCTPLLCDDFDDGTGEKDSKAGDTKTESPLEKAYKKATNGKGKNQINNELDPSTAENMSVAEILEETFGQAGNFCIRQYTGGWWAYEFCPGSYVRQFHEDKSFKQDQFKGIVTAQKEETAGPGVTEYFLGRFISENHKGVTKENEWEQVVNATSSSQGGSKPKPSADDKSPTVPFANAGGNGAYYFQEYTGGDICDDVDVTDSAMKAGAFGEGGIERAITVRYSCNEDLSVAVKEDSTCHYIIDITVPTLCHHPLFRAPVSKRQIVKCLPISS